jgi:hypothetical protein
VPSPASPGSGVFDLRVAPLSNGLVEPQPTDVIGAEPRVVPRRWPWATAVVVLAVALAAAITTAIHYRAAAGRYRVHAATAAGSHGPGPLMLSARTVAIPSSGPLTGEITVFSVRPAHGPAQVMLWGQISGGSPHKRYALVGNDCVSNGSAHPWAAGVTNARGYATLSGPAWTVSPKDEYWLWLVPSPRSQIPGLHGSLTPGGSLTAFPAGWSQCALG